MLTYALVTPARNERANLERLARALREQVVRPAHWIIVDDGSTDGTSEYAASLAAADPAIIVVGARRSPEGELRDGRRQGRDLLAFQHGLDQIPARVDVVAKVDADVDFAPDFWQRILEAFETDPKRALAGGSCHELQDGEWVRRKVIPTAVWGATRAYRWECLDVARALAPRVGWDGIDEIQLQLQGYRTGTLVDLPFYHHRPEGERETAKLRAYKLSGEAAWYMGYRPSYLLARSLYRTTFDPPAVGLVWGYASSALKRTPRCGDAGVIAHLRARQRLSVALRSGAPQ